MRLASHVGHAVRVPALLALVWLAGDPRRQALYEIHTSEVTGPWPAALELVAVGVAFMIVALWGRTAVQSWWLLAIEGAIALLLVLHVSTFGVVLRLSPWTQWVPEAVEPVAGNFGVFVVVPGLALAWLSLVVWSVIRRLRASHPLSGERAKAATAPSALPASPGRSHVGQPSHVAWQALRIPLLLGVLWLSTPVRDEFVVPLTRLLGGGTRTVDPATLWLPGLALAAIMAAFMASLLAGRTRRQSLWLLAVEAMLAAVVPLMAVLTPVVLSSEAPPAWFLGLQRTIAPLAVGSIFLFGATIAWLAVIGWSAAQQLRRREHRVPPEEQDVAPAAP